MKILSALVAILVTFSSLGAAEVEKPNFVYVVVDNLGYGDVGCFGSTLHRTPHLDKMAEEGLKLTHFYVSSGVCTPSRASIMTGCYPRRVNMHESDLGGLVLQPVSPKGLHPDEVTIAEILKEQGYTTSIIGKWHLGDQPELLPTRQGFDYYLGIPYSDDMTPREGKPWPPLPLMKNEKVIDSGVDRDGLTKLYTEAAIEFLEKQAQSGKPFFLYIPQAMPGSTREPFASEAFQGKSKNGKYGDSVEELDWSMGEILKAMKRLDLDKNTLAVWTSDNGAPRRNPPQGSNLPLKGWGYDTSEGGQRVPCIVRWPGHVPAGASSTELCTTMDLYPTFAHMAGGEVPQDRVIDGRDIQPILMGEPGAKSPHDAFYYYFKTQLQAVRSGPWKLYLPLGDKSINGRSAAPTEPQLFNLIEDVSEENNVAAEHPDVVKKLMAYAERARKDLGDEGITGENQRQAEFVDNPTARLP